MRVDLRHFLPAFSLLFLFLTAALLFFQWDSLQAVDRELSPEEPDIPAILLAPGTRVPENLDNPDFWREWIEEIRGTPLPENFSSIAHLFKEEGEKLGIFWPAVLVQSVHETNFCRYGGRARFESLNVGGVGITPDEKTTTRQKFQTLRDGVRAMLEHVAVYADPYKMEKIIREQNALERGAGRFTARRTEEVFRIIRDKYDRFRKQWPGQAVRIIDLGSWPPDEKVEQIGGDKELGQIRQSIRGATLAYAEDPNYGAKLYRWWQAGSSFVSSRYCESQSLAHEDETLHSPETFSHAAFKISLLFLFPTFIF
jgi:hypothetical protein